MDENLNEPMEVKEEAKKITRDLVPGLLIFCIIAGGASGYVGAKLAENSLGTSVNKQPFLQEDSAIIEVVKKASPAVVSIIISKNLNLYQYQSDPFYFDPFSPFRSPAPEPNAAPNFQQTGAGSGFFVTSDGIILTNKHVVADTEAKYTVLTNDGNKYDAVVLAQDPVNDLALVKIDILNAPTLTLADSSQIEIGQRVIAIGNSLGQYRNTVTTGIVSGIGRNITAGNDGMSEQLEGVIQTDAAINPGNSGGPLLNIFGEVIGVNTAIDQQGQLVGFAIPSNDARKDLESYQKRGTITKPFLGVKYVLITPAVREQNNLPLDYGAWITSDFNGDTGAAVIPGSAADRAGLRDGDIIISVDGKRVDQSVSLSGLLKNYSPGDTIVLKVYRDGREIEVQATLGENK